jgi:hypothetical protein
MQIEMTMKFHFTPVIKLSSRKQITNSGEDAREKEPCTLLVGMYKLV